jgi:hypothetical protein
VDAVKRGNVNYNIYREDIAGYFPGYANSDGAAGYFYLDTTAYADGVHTISWAAQDNAGNIDGIGSRYFSIQNTAGRGNPSWLPGSARTTLPGGILDIADIHVDYSSPVSIKKGHNQNTEPLDIYPAEDGIITVEIQELERIEMIVGAQSIPPIEWVGYQLAGDIITPLPIGSTFDKDNAIFYWQPGPGFVGRYDLVFIQNSQQGRMKKTIEVTILPRHPQD